MTELMPHEVNAYVERLKRDVERFCKRNDVPRSAAWIVPDKYTACMDEKELTT